MILIKNTDYILLKSPISLRKLSIFLVGILKFLYSFYIKILCANIIKYCTSDKKMFDSKKFVARNAERMDGWIFCL